MNDKRPVIPLMLTKKEGNFQILITCRDEKTRDVILVRLKATENLLVMMLK